jgi:hypothetical protein
MTWPYRPTPPVIGPLDVESTVELHRLACQLCMILCWKVVNGGAPEDAAPFFRVTQLPLAPALQAFAQLVPRRVWDLLVDEAIHPGGGV